MDSNAEERLLDEPVVDYSRLPGVDSSCVDILDLGNTLANTGCWHSSRTPQCCQSLSTWYLTPMNSNFRVNFVFFNGYRLTVAFWFLILCDTNPSERSAIQSVSGYAFLWRHSGSWWTPRCGESAAEIGFLHIISRLPHVDGMDISWRTNKKPPRVFVMWKVGPPT